MRLYMTGVLICGWLFLLFVSLGLGFGSVSLMGRNVQLLTDFTGCTWGQLSPEQLELLDV